MKAEHIATFLGLKLTGNYHDELGNDFSTRIEGTRIRHHMGPTSIKMYDKFALVLRKDLRLHLPFLASKVCRLIKRLRVHGLVKCFGRTYKYYLTALGRRAVLAGLHIRAIILPRMLTAES